MRPLGIARLSQLKYVVFDIETTGFSRTANQIIQIAAIKVDGRSIQREVKNNIMQTDPKVPLRNDNFIFNGFINPGVSIPTNITDLTGITDAMVRDQPSEGTIISEFLRFVGDRILVAHNGIRFDVPFIEATAHRSNLEIDNLLCLDTLWLSRNLYPQESRHSISALIDKFNIRGSFPARFINQQHNAFVDVVITAKILNIFMNELKTRGKDRLLILDN